MKLRLTLSRLPWGGGGRWWLNFHFFGWTYLSACISGAERSTSQHISAYPGSTDAALSKQLISCSCFRCFTSPYQHWLVDWCHHMARQRAQGWDLLCRDVIQRLYSDTPDDSITKSMSLLFSQSKLITAASFLPGRVCRLLIARSHLAACKHPSAHDTLRAAGL